MRATRTWSVCAAGVLMAIAIATPVRAQQGGGTPPGWTFVPAVSYAGAFDDNISLFARDTAEAQNNDYISTVAPAIDLRYGGRQSEFSVAYSGSLVNYITFSALNRYNQSLNGRFDRRESARLRWNASGRAWTVPSTDLIELGGIPYQQAAARTLDGAGGVEIALNARNSIRGQARFQRVDFEPPDTSRPALPGGDGRDYTVAFRRRQTARASWGGDYTFQQSRVSGDPERFTTQLMRGTFDYALSPAWRLSLGGGMVHLAETIVSEARNSPAWNVGIERNENQRIFRAGYTRAYIPSFGYGGAVDNHEVGASMEWPLSRRVYTANGFSYRRNSPLTNLLGQLPLRSLRMSSVVGWSPRPWVQVEAFYARTQQNSLTFASLIARNRFGFQIVTSTPVRIR
jgi:hypothetical protein